MSQCKKCGRSDGHYIGCARTASRSAAPVAESGCSFEGCSQPRRSEDKRVKFCDEHSDPKNRKA